MLIPKLIVEGDYRYILDILGDEHFRKKVRLSKEVKDVTVGDENEVLELVKEQKNSFRQILYFTRKIIPLIEFSFPSKIYFPPV